MLGYSIRVQEVVERAVLPGLCGRISDYSYAPIMANRPPAAHKKSHMEIPIQTFLSASTWRSSICVRRSLFTVLLMSLLRTASGSVSGLSYPSAIRLMIDSTLAVPQLEFNRAYERIFEGEMATISSVWVALQYAI